MAASKVVYYFTLISPWAYLGHAEFLAIARRHGAGIEYRAIGLGGIFPHTGGVPLAKRAPARQAYRLMDLQRWREIRNVPLNLHPKYFPVDISLTDRALIALLDEGADPQAYIRAAFRAVWVEDRDLSDRQELAGLLQRCGVDASAILAKAESPMISAQYEENVRQALTAGVFGSPTYVLNGEVFFGQDRLDLLDRALTSGRQPYAPA